MYMLEESGPSKMNDENLKSATVVITADQQRPNAVTKHSKPWNSIQMPNFNINPAKKLRAVVNQPKDGEFEGENFYDSYKQLNYELQFHPSPSGADTTFYLPRENPRPVVMNIVESIEFAAQRTMTEIFSAIRVIFAILIAFFVELGKTVFAGIAQPLLVGIVTIVGAHLLQPLLVVFFNHIVAPLFSFLHNSFSAGYRSMQPLFDIFGRTFSSLAELVKSFRLVDITVINQSKDDKSSQITTSTSQQHHVVSADSLQPA